DVDLLFLIGQAHTPDDVSAVLVQQRVDLLGRVLVLHDNADHGDTGLGLFHSLPPFPLWPGGGHRKSAHLDAKGAAHSFSAPPCAGLPAARKKFSVSRPSLSEHSSGQSNQLFPACGRTGRPLRYVYCTTPSPFLTRRSGARNRKLSRAPPVAILIFPHP